MFELFILCYSTAIFFILRGSIHSTNEKVDQLIRTIAVMETLIDRIQSVEHKMDMAQEDLDEMHKQLIVYEHMNKKRSAENLKQDQ